MSDSPNLDIEHLASNLTSPEPIINEQLDKVDAAIAGRLTINLTTDADYTLANPSGSTPAEWSYPDITLTDTGGVLTTGRAIIMPSGKGIVWRVANGTLQTLTFKVSGGTGVAVSAAGEAFLYYDGTDIAEQSGGGGGGASALDDLSDVDTTGAADGDALTYDSGTGTWVPGAGGTSLPVDDTTALVRDPADNTKQVGIDAGAVGAGKHRRLAMPDRDIDLTGHIPAIQASDSLTWHEASRQTISSQSYETVFDLAGSVELVGGVINGAVTGVRLTLDGTVVYQRTSAVYAVDSGGSDLFGASVLPPARATNGMKLEVYNGSVSAREMGWRVATR